MTDFIEVTGHELWVPIPLDRDPDEVHDQLSDRFGPGDPAADNAALLSGVARRLAEADDGAGRTGVHNLAAWALVTQPDELVVRALATLRAVLLEPGVTAEEVVRGLAGDEPLFEAPAVRPIDTRSGEALTVRLRPMVDEGPVPQVHELAAVLWARPEVEAWHVLSTYSTDLVEAREVGELLEELAAGIEGL